MFQYKNPTKRVGLVQSGPHYHLIECNLFSLTNSFVDHKKMSGALEKCHFCFGNVPKHLIIAIGTKVCKI